MILKLIKFFIVKIKDDNNNKEDNLLPPMIRRLIIGGYLTAINNKTIRPAVIE